MGDACVTHVATTGRLMFTGEHMRVCCGSFLILVLALPVAAFAGGNVADHTGEHADAAADSAIRAVMKQTWERADAPLTIGPVVVSGDTAIADWQQNNMRGRALLRKVANHWDVVGCAGKSFRDMAGLQQHGVDQATAHALSHALSTAEASLPAADIEQMDQFGERSHIAPATGHQDPGKSPSTQGGDVSEHQRH